MTTNLITFGAGSENYKEAGLRLCKQAKNINLFSRILFFDDNYLKNDEEFWKRHSEFIENNKKGYGYWLWKPYIIKKTIDSLNDGDILMYLDSGCEINTQKRNEMIKYFNIVKTEYIISSFTYIEKYWAKMDLIKHLNVNVPEYLDTPQRQAGALLLYVCPKIRSLVNEWYETACNYNLIDDSPSIEINVPGFGEHRHDQSIFSLLTKKYNIKNKLYIEEIVEYIRNRTGIPRFR